MNLPSRPSSDTKWSTFAVRHALQSLLTIAFDDGNNIVMLLKTEFDENGTDFSSLKTLVSYDYAGES